MIRRGTTSTFIITIIAIFGVFAYFGYKGYISKTLIPFFAPQASPLTSDQNHGYKLFKGLFVDEKYGFSFRLPDYFGRHGGWSSDNEWEKDANPDYLYILPLETAKPEDSVFKGNDELSGRLKEFSISVSKNTTIDKWRGKTRTVFNSQADGWGMDHKFIDQTYDSTNKSLNVLRFTYLDQVLMPGNPQVGDEYDTGDGYDTIEPVTGIAVQKGSNVIVLSMKHDTNYDKEVDSLFTQILSTIKFTQ